jgi:hypothetical protein
MRVGTFLDLTCGTGSLGLRLATGTKVKPLMPYMGWKKNLAQHILDVAEVEQGADRLIFVDAGPWGRAWQAIAREEQREAVISILQHYTREQPKELYERLKAEPVPSSDVRFCARFLTLQRWAYGSKPVGIVGDRWSLPGYCKPAGEGVPARKTYGEVKPQLPSTIKILKGYAKLETPIFAYQGDSRRIEFTRLGPGDLVYIDPNYKGRTGYRHSLSREEVLRLGRWWAEKGCTVIISEGEPLTALNGWETADLTNRRGQVHTFPAEREEWITFKKGESP